MQGFLLLVQRQIIEEAIPGNLSKQKIKNFYCLKSKHIY
jgi:hypothetical protein